jgi:hypothetical protein
MIMYGSVLPSYSSKKDGAENKEVINGDSKENKGVISSIIANS